jgi:hypothetical protein
MYEHSNPQADPPETGLPRDDSNEATETLEPIDLSSFSMGPRPEQRPPQWREQNPSQTGGTPNQFMDRLYRDGPAGVWRRRSIGGGWVMRERARRSAPIRRWV